MNKVRNIIWGIILVATGVLIALSVLDIISINLMFKGWWTLFIIVPCGVGLITERSKIGNLIGLAIGVALLLAARGIISYGMIWKLTIPAAIVIIGIVMICKAIGGKDRREAERKLKENKLPLQEYCAAFSGVEADYSNQVFTGASLTAVFGGVELDLRNAIINEDVVIKVSCVFGGVDVLLPDDVNLKVSSSCIFGGVSDKKKLRNKSDRPTVYVCAGCVFGGCDIE